MSRDGRSYIARVLPYRSIDNFIAGAGITFVDVTSTVKAETALRESGGRLRTLLAELQHRLCNTLAVVKSIARRTADSSGSVEEMAAHLNGRLDAFARVQSAVTRNPEAGIELRSLIDDELTAHAAREGYHLSIDGPDVALRPEAAESVSLALHGRIAIRWDLNGQGKKESLVFEWLESRPNGRLPKPARQGFGMELLTRILPYDLEAKTSVEFLKEGLRFTMDLPGEHVTDARR